MFEYKWVSVRDNLSALGKKGWRIVPGILYRAEVLMERNVAAVEPQDVPPPSR